MKNLKSYKNQIGEINVIQQWRRLLGFRAACLFFHSEVDAPTSHLTDVIGKKHHSDTICKSNILYIRFFFLLFL